ncbi:VOC family protein [Symbioplanes lichenis]|uniref:VOC family protein n=1 Tax=Symbioplanes lichenis TaxID=1629072 RepID=UPI002738B7D3|nr:VOC family protein [Actinoplanes lichenis]
MIAVTAVDHLVLTVASIDRTVAFYRDVLGLRAEQFGAGRWALHFGDQKFNLHEAGHEFEPKAAAPAPGAIDVCLVTATPLDQVTSELRAHGVPIVEGPVERTGARGPIISVYVRDPDGNLIELANYADPSFAATREAP